MILKHPLATTALALVLIVVIGLLGALVTHSSLIVFATALAVASWSVRGWVQWRSLRQ